MPESQLEYKWVVVRGGYVPLMLVLWHGPDSNWDSEESRLKG